MSDFDFIRRVGDIEEYRLPANGLRVLRMASHAAPVALLMLTYGVGSRHEGPGTRGGSHMLEHMMFKGSERFHRSEGRSIFDMLHPLGAQANATTWFDRTHYFDLVPSEHLDIAAEIEADRMRGLRILPEDLESERDVVLNEHDMVAGDPLERLHLAVWGEAFREHPYGHPVIGTRDDIRALDRDGLYAHYHRYYHPDNATLTLIGDLDRDRVRALALRHFASIPARGGGFDPDDGDEPAQQGERRVTIAQSGGAGLVMLGYRMPEATHPDVPALELLGMILGAGKLSRLHRPLVSAGLANHVWCTVSRLRRPGLFQVQAMLCDEAHRDAVERTMRDAIADLAEHGVADRELARVRGRARGDLLLSRDGPMAIAMQLNEAIAAGDWTSHPMLLDRLDAVRAEDVRRVARQYLVDAQLTVGHLVETAELAS
jgi:zinc protease